MCRDWRFGQAVRSIDVIVLDERLRVSSVGMVAEITNMERSLSPRDEVTFANSLVYRVKKSLPRFRCCRACS